MTLSAKRRNENGGCYPISERSCGGFDGDGSAETRKEVYAKLLKFLNTNDRIGVDRLYGILSPTGTFTFLGLASRP